MSQFKKASVGVALALIFAAVPIMANAQSYGQQGQSQSTTPSGESPNHYNSGKKCPITHVVAGCGQITQLPRFASRSECTCTIRKIKFGGKSQQVRDCYGVLPNNTVHFCNQRE